MEILEAYCEDLGRVVEIYEAQEEYFAQPPGSRRRFVFRCSDPACRAMEKSPLIVGVNYDKDVEASEKYQQAHFKSHAKHPHSDACIWMADEAGKGGKDTGAEGSETRHARAKATNVIDVFEPRGSDILRSAVPVDGRTRTDVLVDGEPQEGGQAGDRTGTTTTSRLEKLVDCWSQMEQEDRSRHRITIDGSTLGYHRLCVHVKALSEGENGARIVYGGAHVKAWPADAPSHYFVNFIDDCAHFAEASGARSVTIALPIDRLKQAKRGALLISRIEQACKPKHYLKVYAWGSLVARTRGKGYELSLAALDNLVLKVIEKQPVSNPGV